uniref:Putative Bacteriohemerythrin n=1 Tax=Magnetococcus massalia (strain MO-1) TaxID=451514 RepID=A0A1S7LFQ2_MAGMO|nr:putative Bacteriohemerythrin [Candidatus Magnetococcus massalia]
MSYDDYAAMEDLIEWTPALSVGNEVIDKEHQILLEMINRLYAATFMNTSDSLAEKIVNELIDYTHTHFNHEETFLKEQGYKGLEQHRIIHNELVRQVIDFKFAIKSGTVKTSGNELEKFLRSWMIKHIQGHDFEYADNLSLR